MMNTLAKMTDLLFFMLLLGYGAFLHADPAAVNDLNIEDLLKMKVPAISKETQIKKKMLNVKVSSVAKSSQNMTNAASAVYVIDNEAIRRSGVTSVPEALRLAPGVDVARVNNSKWAITARGFNGRFANKLLVLVDGRSVYTPDFGGVYWDAQDMMLEDVERIEVIRGPGATLWGSNGMNGVINIITKHTGNTQGGLLSAGGGTQQTGFGALRYGTQLGEDTYARAYVKGFSQDQFSQIKPADGGNADWNQFQGGFRMDSTLSAQDNFMLQGIAYKGQPNQALQLSSGTAPFTNYVNTSGWNITSRLSHNISSTADYSVQFYYDHYQRDEFQIDNERNTVDFDFQNNFAFNTKQNVIWGLGYRYTDDVFSAKPRVVVSPNMRGTQLFNAFAQDEISFWDNKLLLTLGSRLEHNDYTGFEFQPTARMMWTPATGHKVWVSASRAVRTPSRVEQQGQLLLQAYAANSQNNPLPVPVNVVLSGNPTYKAEQQLSYELGYRWTFNHNFSWDISTFYNIYNTLRGESQNTFSAVNGTLVDTIYFNNLNSAHTYGFESSHVWQMLDWWRWDLNYSLLKTQLNAVDGYQVAVSPEHNISLRAGLNPIDKVTLDFWLRHISSAQTINPYGSTTFIIPAYTTMDIRLAWQPIKKVELSIAGQNLLQSQHIEYLDESYAVPAGVPRSVYFKVNWQF